MNRHLLGQYRRLNIAVADVLEAHQYAIYILENDLHDTVMPQSDTVLKGLSVAMVVSYSRAFLTHRGGSDERPTTRKASGNLLADLTKEEKEVHERVLALRNSEIAHSDADAHSMSLNFITPPDRSAERIITATAKSTGDPLSQADTECLAIITSKVFEAMKQQQVLLMERIPDAKKP